MATGTPTSTSDLLQRNAEYLVDHIPQYHYKAENFVTTTRMIIVSCMDQRVVPEQFCRLKAGEIPVIRCAGGRARFAIHDIASLNALIGINEILVVHHTDCGAMHKDSDYVRRKLEARSPEEALKIDLDDWTITEFVHPMQLMILDESVRKDVLWLRNHSLIDKATKVTGAIYDIDTGLLTVKEI